MPYYWSHWLADALRSDPVLAPRVVEVPGWMSRGRPPASYSYLPSGTVDHHTACMVRTGHNPQSCVDSIIAGNSVAPGPISQLLVSWTPAGVRWNGNNADPRVFIIAAGRSNHAGSGIYRWGAPSGNGSSIGIEVCGPSEIADWPDSVVDVRARVTAAIHGWNGWDIERQAMTHWEYAVPSGRKIDPSGAYNAEPNLTWNAHWNPDIWRSVVKSKLNVSEDTLKGLKTPIRVLDTRDRGGIPGAGQVHEVGIMASEVGVNICVVDPPGPGFLTAWGSNPRPNTANVNFTTGETQSNYSHVVLDGGTLRLWCSQPCHIVVDLQASG